MRLLKYFIIGIAFGAVAFGVGRWVYLDKRPEARIGEISSQQDIGTQQIASAEPAQLNPAQPQDGTPGRLQITQNLQTQRCNAITNAISEAVPAVVGISVTQVREYITRSPLWDDPFLRSIFPPRILQRPVKNLGSGFIISSDGYIVTNEHVVHGATEILVTMSGGGEAKAAIVGSDPYSDVALLKIEASDLPYLKFGDSDSVIMGEWAIAIGNPFGLFEINDTPSVTVGVVSATNRDFDRLSDGRIYSDMIQTDASINRGNSGGPLVNCVGEVIGMNTMIFTEGGGGSLGIGFAIPVNRIREIINELRDTGMVNRNYWIGLKVQNLNRLIAKSLGLKSDEGVIVSEIDPGSPAQKAGIKVGDVVMEIAGTTVRNYRSILSVMDKVDLRVGDKLSMKIFRNGKVQDFNVFLEEVPG